MKLLSATVGTVFICLSLSTISVAEPAHLCYIVTSSGRLMDLTDSLCNKEKKNQPQIQLTPSQSNIKQEELLEAYKRQAYKRQQLQKKAQSGR